MRELSVEEKAKAYDKVREKIDLRFGSNVAEEIFSQFEESEDERIRKELLSVINDLVLPDEQQSRFVAWLEKQGEQPTNKAESKFHKDDWIVRDNDGFTTSIESIRNKTHYYFHQGGNLLAEVVDESYHLWTIADAKDGDIVVDKSDGTIGIFQSIGHRPDGGSYNDPSYCFLHCRYDDGFFYADFEHGNIIGAYDLIPATKEQREELEKAMADAGYTFDFEKKELKKIKQKHADKIEPKFKVGDLVEYTNHDKQPIYKINYIDKECYVCTSDDVTLGDKAVMHFAFDNPYLRLVEQQPIDTYCREHCKGYQLTGRCFADGECQAKRDNDKKLQQKTKETMFDKSDKWSEEDEQYLLVCKNALTKYQTTDKWDVHIIFNWLENKLKSLKERVQPKQEWSGEDEVISEELIKYFESLLDSLATEERHNENRRWLNWLKSIKDRVQPIPKQE